LSSHLQTEIARRLSIEPHEIDPRGQLMALGMTSLKAVELKTEIERDLGTRLPASVVFDCPTLETLTRFLLERVGLLDHAPDARTTSPAAPAECPAGADPHAQPTSVSEQLRIELGLLRGQK
jgi:polyketide synthase 12/epothilone polyketide synthase D